MKNLCYTIVFLCLIQGCCNSPGGEKSKICVIEAVKAVDTVAESHALEKLAGKVELVPLETSAASMLGKVSDIILSREHIFVLHGGRCSMFDRSGKFISGVGQKGNGPQEYLYIESMFFRNDTVYLYDVDKNKIHAFASGSSYCNSFDIAAGLRDCRGMALTGENRFVAYTPDKGFPERKRALTFFTTQGIVTDSILRISKLSKPANINWYFPEGTFTAYKGRLNYKELLCDTVYSIVYGNGGYRTVPEYVFDLGPYKAIENAREEISNTFMSAKPFNPFSKMVKIELLGETKSCLFFSMNGEKVYFYDKRKNTLHKWRLFLSGHEQQEKNDPGYFTPLKIDGSGHLLGLMNPDNDENNPVVVVAELK